MELEGKEPKLSDRERRIIQIRARLAQIDDLERFAATNEQLGSRLDAEKAELDQKLAELGVSE